jgi:membrane fusion protein (multidrug efflux system)
MIPRKFTLLAILAALLVLASCNEEQTKSTTEVTVSVRVSKLEKGSMEQTETITGTARSKKEIILMSETEGDYILLDNPMTGKPFELGDEVKKGTLVITLANKEYENSIQMESKEMDFEINQMEFEKQQSLYAKGGVTLRELKSSEGSLINAKYALENAQYSLEKMNISAPFDGVIVSMPYFTPETKVASGTEVLTLMDYRDMYITFSLPEKSIAAVDINQEVYVVNYTMPEDTLMGEVSQLSPAIDETTRTFSGVIEIENKDLKLRPGMFIQGDIVTLRNEDVFILSKEIVSSSTKGSFVYVADKGMARQKRIQTGLENANEIEIISGLTGEEMIVTEGYETLRDRSKIKILK